MLPLTLVAAAAGGAAMYLFDPDRGARRRALLRDQVVHTLRISRDAMDAGARDIANRSTGAVGRARSLLTRRHASDDVLVERVRAKMGRYVSHPGAIEVDASGGTMRLSGSILRDEHDGLLAAVRGVAGVKDIVDSLTVYETAEGISELQGGIPRRGEEFELMQDNWAPAARILIGAAGTALVLHGLRGGLPGILLAAAGAIILLRTTTNKPLHQLAGLSGQGAVGVPDATTPATGTPSRDAASGEVSHA